MKCAIKFDSYLIADVEELAPILKALTGGNLYTASGWGFDKNTKLTLSEEKPTIHLVDEGQFTETPEPVKVLQARLAESDSRWYQYYTEAQTAKKELAELQAKLDKITTTVKGEPS